MRRLCLLIVALALAGAGPSAQRRTITYESITVGATAVGISAATTNPPGLPQQTGCQGRLETAQIRYRYDGTDPTAAEGILLEIGDFLSIASNEDARTIRFIRVTATSGTLKLHCWP